MKNWKNLGINSEINLSLCEQIGPWTAKLKNFNMWYLNEKKRYFSKLNVIWKKEALYFKTVFLYFFKKKIDGITT